MDAASLPSYVVPGLADAVTQTAELARMDSAAIADPLSAERWASVIAVAWAPDPELDHIDRERLFGLALVAELEAAGDPSALAVLRALAAVGSERLAAAARHGAGRLAARGLEEPPWAAAVGRAKPSGALVVSPDSDELEAVVGIGYDYGGEHPHALAAFVRHGPRGVGHLGVVGSLQVLRDEFGGGGLDLAEGDVSNAAFLLAAALDFNDGTPGSVRRGREARELGALCRARVRAVLGESAYTC